MQESSPIFSEKSDSKLLITDTEELLAQFQLTNVDLNRAIIQIEDLKRAASPAFLGKCLHFLVTVSISRSLMLWPFMLRGSIKLNKNTLAETQKIFPVKHKKDTSPILSISDTDDGDLLPVNDMGPEEVNVSMLNESEENETSDGLILKISAPILTSSSLLLESESALRGISAVGAFHDTTDALLNGVWNAFLSSLIINGVVNYILYPDEREPTALVDAFGITGLRNIACIRAIESIKNSVLCSESYKKGYDDILSFSLSSYYVWPFIAGIPLIFATINAIRASWNMKALGKQAVKALIQQLKEYKPGFWADGLGWLVTAAIPDLFPPAAILFMLPQPTIKQVLEKIKQTIIWDGRLSAKDRQLLFNHLTKFAQQRSQFTQMKALSMLADIVDGINFKNLSLLKEEGVDNETIKTLAIIKTKALKELDFLANHYNLPDAPRSYFRPLFRYLYTNYLMWSLGYPRQGLLQPLFFASKAIKLYYTLIFFKAIIGGIIEIINNYLSKKNCLETGKEWTFFKELDEWKCTVCEDFNISYRDIFTTKDCVSAYLAEPKPFTDCMINIVNRELRKNSWGIDRSFNLSEVTKLMLITKPNFEKTFYLPGELAILLEAMKPKMRNLQMMDLRLPFFQNGSDAFNLNDIDAISRFIEDSDIEIFHLLMGNVNDYLLNAIGYVLPKTKIKSISINNNLANGNEVNRSSIEEFTLGLKSSEVSQLDFGTYDIGDTGLRAIASILPYSKITSFILTHTRITSEGCTVLAAQLPLSRIVTLKLSIYSLGPVCINALIEALKRMSRDFDLDLSGAHSSILDLFAKALSTTPTLSLKRLLLTTDKSVTQEAILDILQALPKSHLVKFGTGFPDNLNYTILVPQLADAIDQSLINDFSLTLPSSFSRQASEILISFLPGKLHKITYLSFWQPKFIMSRESMKTLFLALPNTNIEEFMFSDQKVGNLLEVLAEVLPQTVIKKLWLDNCNITSSEISFLAKVLNKTKIENLILNDNYIGDEGIKILFEGLYGSFVKSLSLGGNHITIKGAQAIVLALTTERFKHDLWINSAGTDKQNNFRHAYNNPRTNLELLALNNNYKNPTNFIGDEGALALCNILYQTNISPQKLFLRDMNISRYIIDNCGIFSDSISSASPNSLRPTGPYVFLYRLYHVSQQSLQSFYAILYERYKASVVDSVQPEPEYNDTPADPISSDDFSKQAVSVMDASYYSGSETIVIDLNSHDASAAMGSINSNNLFIGSDNSLLDVSQTRQTNFLQSGKNNKLRLGFFSKDHVVVAEKQGIIQIDGFASKDTLHFISDYTVYGVESNKTNCQNEIIENDIPAAVIHIKETTVQLLNTRCEDIKENIEINNNEAMYAARAEVMDATENHQSILYSNLLSVCETFLNSVSKSAIFTAVPAFAAEILYRSGGFTRGEAEKFGQEIQTILVLSFADSPHAIAASSLASLLASRLTNSPNIISIVGIGASIVTSVATTVLSNNVALGWMALQTGVALMGSVAGSYSVRWGMNKGSNVKDYLSSKIGFWSGNIEEIKEEKSAHQNVMFHTESILSDVDQDSRPHFTI